MMMKKTSAKPMKRIVTLWTENQSEHGRVEKGQWTMLSLDESEEGHQYSQSQESFGC